MWYNDLWSTWRDFFSFTRPISYIYIICLRWWVYYPAEPPSPDENQDRLLVTAVSRNTYLSLMATDNLTTAEHTTHRAGERPIYVFYIIYCVHASYTYVYRSRLSYISISIVIYLLYCCLYGAYMCIRKYGHYVLYLGLYIITLQQVLCAASAVCALAVRSSGFTSASYIVNVVSLETISPWSEIVYRVVVFYCVLYIYCIADRIINPTTVCLLLLLSSSLLCSVWLCKDFLFDWWLMIDNYYLRSRMSSNGLTLLTLTSTSNIVLTLELDIRIRD